MGWLVGELRPHGTRQWATEVQTVHTKSETPAEAYLQRSAGQKPFVLACAELQGMLPVEVDDILRPRRVLEVVPSHKNNS